MFNRYYKLSGKKLAVNSKAMASTPNYVIIDTDAGVDDALALMLAFDCHKKGLIDILAITCVYGNICVDKVIKNVLLTQRACNSLVRIEQLVTSNVSTSFL